MADTGRTRASLLTEMADNTTRIITAQYMRDFVVTTVPQANYISGNYTVTTNDGWICCLPSGTSNYTLTMPDAVGASGKIIMIYKEFPSASGIVTVAASGSQTIMGLSSLSMASKYVQLETYSDGGSWELINHDDFLGWRDLTGDLVVRGGVNSPSYNAVGSSGFYAYEFVSNQLKEGYANFHIQHDYAPSTEIYAHIHWMPAASGLGGQSVQWFFQACYAKGYNQGAFNINTPTLVNVITTTSGIPIYQHMISEIKITDITGASGLINSSNIQTDGIIMLRVYRNGGVGSDNFASSVFVPYIDVHYQVRRPSTLNRNYPFE